jgi:hypothetical protein
MKKVLAMSIGVALFAGVGFAHDYDDDVVR